MKPDGPHADFLQFRTASREFFHYVHKWKPITDPRKGTEVCEGLQRFHDHPVVKEIQALQLFRRIVDRDLLNG